MVDRIVVDPDIQRGKPVIRGTRVPVTRIVGGLAGGMSIEEVVREYGVTVEDVRAALRYANELVESEEFHPPPVPGRRCALPAGCGPSSICGGGAPAPRARGHPCSGHRAWLGPGQRNSSLRQVTRILSGYGRSGVRGHQELPSRTIPWDRGAAPPGRCHREGYPRPHRTVCRSG